MENLFTKAMTETLTAVVKNDLSLLVTNSEIDPDLALLLFCLSNMNEDNEIRMSVPEMNALIYNGKRHTEQKIRKAARRLINLGVLYLMVRDTHSFPRWCPDDIETTAKWYGLVINPNWFYKGGEKKQHYLWRKKNEDFEIMYKQERQKNEIHTQTDKK